MKISRWLSVLPVVLLWSQPAAAQDPVKVAPDHYSVIMENAAVRVLKITYAPGSKAAMHHHPDSIAIPLVTSKVRMGLADGTTQDTDLPAGSATYAPAGTHSPTNIGKAAVDIILVEFKGAKPGTAALPGSRPNMASKTLAEGPYGAVFHNTADPAFHEPAGSKHDYDQVVISLDAAQMSLAIDGKPAKTSWKRGDVQFIGRGVAHESRNTGNKPVEFVIVAVK
jgi:mannose-6-phosphate isomerase-like protein (cupin superfamily)